MRLPLTLNIQCGKKLSGKSKDQILKEVLVVFQHYHVRCVQVAYEVIRVTLASADEYKVAKQQPGIRLFGMWCPILGGGPPITILHIFDYPYEEEDVYIKNVIGDFGSVKRVKKQTYLTCPDVFTGTRLVSVTLDATPPPPQIYNYQRLSMPYLVQGAAPNLQFMRGARPQICGLSQQGQM